MIRVKNKITQDTTIWLNAAFRSSIHTAYLFIFDSDLSENVWLGYAVVPPNYRNKNNKLVVIFRDYGVAVAPTTYAITAYVRNFDENNTDGFFNWNKVNAVSQNLTINNGLNALKLEWDVPYLEKDLVTIQLTGYPASGDRLYISHAYIVSREG